MQRNPWPKGKSRKRSQAAKKAWETIRSKYGKNAGSKMAKKAWETIRGKRTPKRKLSKAERSKIAQKAAHKAWRTRKSGKLSASLKEEVIFDLWEGIPVKRIAKKHGIDIGQVNLIGRQAKMPGKRGRPKKRPAAKL